MVHFVLDGVDGRGVGDAVEAPPLLVAGIPPVPVASLLSEPHDSWQKTKVKQTMYLTTFISARIFRIG